MVTKYSLLLLLIAGLFIPCFAQKQSMTKKAYQKQLRTLMLQNYRVPTYSPAPLNNEIQGIKKLFAEFTFPKTIRELKSMKEAPTDMILLIKSTNYKRLLSSSELEEATGNRLSWYNKIGVALVDLNQPLTAIKKAYMQNDNHLYRMAVSEYQQKAKKLAQIISAPERLTSSELEKIQAVNTKKRKDALQKKIRELQNKGF